MTMMTVEGVLALCCIVAEMCNAFQQRVGRNKNRRGNSVTILTLAYVNGKRLPKQRLFFVFLLAKRFQHAGV